MTWELSLTGLLIGLLVGMTGMGGGALGVLVGSQWTVRLPERALRIALAMVLLLSGVKLLGVPARI